MELVGVTADGDTRLEDLQLLVERDQRVLAGRSQHQHAVEPGLAEVTDERGGGGRVGLSAREKRGHHRRHHHVRGHVVRAGGSCCRHRACPPGQGPYFIYRNRSLQSVGQGVKGHWDQTLAGERSLLIDSCQSERFIPLDETESDATSRPAARHAPEENSVTRLKRATVFATVVAVATLALAACGPASTTTPPTSGEPAAGGDLRISLYQQPVGFNTLKPGIGGDQLIESLHFDTLLGWNLETSEYESRLAESWTVSDDGLTLTFDLIPGLKWSDGEAFTADDVVFTYNLHANPAAASSTAGFLSNVVGFADVQSGSADTLEGVVAEDDDTVTFTLTKPDSSFIGNFIPGAFNFGWILPEHALADVDPAAMGELEWFREPTAGMGPYVFSKWLSDSQIEFVANPEFRSELKLDRVFASTLTSDVAQAQLQTGELHLTNVPAVDVETVRGIAGVTVESAPGAGVLALHTAMDTHPELADPRVRQAMMYAIDRQAIIDEAFHGEGSVVNVLAHGPEWAVPSGLETYDYNPDKARDLLKQANWDSSREVTLEVVPGQKDRD
ncbi:MAG: ABC transporter substrate-binding protein, partial [Microbacterium sp.]